MISATGTEPAAGWGRVDQSNGMSGADGGDGGGGESGSGTVRHCCGRRKWHATR